MNKLAVLAFSMLAILGGLLWYVAGSSLNPYLAQYALEINKDHTDVSVSFGLTELNNHQGVALTEKFEFSPQIKANAPKLTMRNIRFNYDPKSFKKDAVEINSITIESITLSLSRQDIASDITLFNESLSLLLASQKLADTGMGITGKKEPLINITQLNIKTLYVTLFEDEEPQQEQIFQALEVLPTNQQGTLSVVFTQLIEDIIEQSSQLLATSEL